MSRYDYGWNTLEAEANDPKTSPKRLAHLAGSKLYCIRLAVARNPNTPKSALIDLAKTMAGSVRNAVIENPNCPPLVKIWIQSGYSGMTLTEFILAAEETS